MSYEDDLNHLAHLTENWDSYGSPPISYKAIQAAKGISVTPTNTGGVMVSWNFEHTMITFNADGEIEEIYHSDFRYDYVEWTSADCGRLSP